MPVNQIDPHRVRFSQHTVRFAFKDGGTIATLADTLRTGRLDLETFPPIRLVERNGQLFTLDNRRLEAFRRAGVPVPYRLATFAEASRERWKFTTRTDGLSVEVKGELHP